MFSLPAFGQVATNRFGFDDYLVAGVRVHLLSAKNAKRKRHLGKMARVHKTDEARVKANLPFG